MWLLNLKWLVVAEALNKGTFFLFNVLSARELGAKEYGMFATAQALSIMLWIIFDLGINFYAPREIAAAKKSQSLSGLISTLFSIRLTSGFISLILLLPIIYITMPEHQATLFALALLYILLNGITTDWVFRGLQKYSQLPVIGVVSSVVIIVGYITVVSMIQSNSYKSYGLMTVWLLAYFISGLVSLKLLKAKTGISIVYKLQIARWIKHIKESIYFSLSGGLSSFMQSFPLLMLSYFASEEAAGQFAAPFRFILSIVTLIFLITSSSYPSLSESYAKDREGFVILFNQVRRAVIVVGISAVVLTTAILILFTDKLFGADFVANSPMFLLILAASILIVALRSNYGTALFASSNQRLHLKSTFLAALLMVIIGGILVPFYVQIGAALTFLSSELFVLLFMRYFLINSLKDRV